MEEDIKTIENIIDTLKFHIEYENYEENILDECKRDIKALENLLKENKQLKTDKALQIQMNKRLIEEGIPISVIQNKLDELDNELEEKYSAEKISVFSGNTYMEKFKLLGGRQVLQELLEERNK